jgi:CBS domain-containing protein
MSIFTSLIQGTRRRKLRRCIAALSGATVGEIMTSYVVSARPDDTVIATATKMIAEDISCLLVMEGDTLKGILSERDFLHKVPLDRQVFAMKVKDIMSPNVVTIPPSTKLVDAVKMMKERNFRRLPVADGKRVVGIVTQTDFSRRLREAFPFVPDDPHLAVQQIMSKGVLTASPKESFAAARERMRKRNVGSILIEENGVSLGIFTEYDVVMQFYDQQGNLRVKELSSFMRKYVRAAPADLNLLAANALLNEKKMRRLPVVQEKKVVGIVTQTDIVRYVYLHLDAIREALEKVVLVPVPKEFIGEFRGEHLKVYGA